MKTKPYYKGSINDVKVGDRLLHKGMTYVVRGTPINKKDVTIVLVSVSGSMTRGTLPFPADLMFDGQPPEWMNPSAHAKFQKEREK